MLTLGVFQKFLFFLSSLTSYELIYMQVYSSYCHLTIPLFWLITSTCAWWHKKKNSLVGILKLNSFYAKIMRWWWNDFFWCTAFHPNIGNDVITFWVNIFETNNYSECVLKVSIQKNYKLNKNVGKMQREEKTIVDTVV